MHNLIEKLQQKRDAQHLKNDAFAHSLGISPELWSRLQSGERKITAKFLSMLAVKFPDLHWDILNFLIKNEKGAK